LRTILRLAKERPQLGVVADQRGNPTYAPHLAEAILTIAAKLATATAPPWGIYHAASSGDTTWHEFAAAIIDAAGPPPLPPLPVRPLPPPPHPPPPPPPPPTRLP